jgi:hypothetical protein
MRAHELQREDTHANRDEQQREEYQEMFSIDPQTLKAMLLKKNISRKGATAQRKTAKIYSLRLCAFAGEIFFI